MGLSSLPNSLSGQVNTTMPAIKDTSLYANSGIPSIPKLTEERISLRTTQFIEKMSQTFFEQLYAPEARSLNELLMFISKNGVDSIPQDALVKNAGYFTRFFSSESWQDWCKDKTHLGEVVSLYCECVTSTTGLKTFMDRLDKNVLKVSNKEARLLLKSLKNEKKPPEPQVEVEQVSTTSSNRVGDINSDDDIADFVIGAPGDDSPRGQTYVIYGKKDVSLLDGINGFVLNGEYEFDYSGASVSEEDINQDNDRNSMDYPRRK
jgi:hypothetical protein